MPLFNGKDLTGWHGDARYWSVQRGVLLGQTTLSNPTEQNTFLIWDGAATDFRLRVEYRIDSGNSGVQYRSQVIDPGAFIVAGYQANIEAGVQLTGSLYDERGRQTLALRGEHVEISSQGRLSPSTFADGVKLQHEIHPFEWNELVIEVRGNQMRHTINDRIMCDVADFDRKHAKTEGAIALELHRGLPVRVQFRKIELTKFESFQDNPFDLPLKKLLDKKSKEER